MWNTLTRTLKAKATSVSYFISFPSLLFVLGVVVPGRPARVLLHVQLPLHPGHLVVLGLVIAGQRVPLDGEESKNKRVSRIREMAWGTWVVSLVSLSLLLL